MNKIRQSYQHFFLKDEGGKEFMLTLERLIDSNHEAAEKNPELSRDYAQRAAGMRIILNHILSAVSELKGGPKK